jgi:hypothetical protein
VPKGVGVLPRCRAEVAAKEAAPYRLDAPQVGQHMDVYPPLGIGRQPAAAEAAAAKAGVVPMVVCGPCKPQCGSRSLADGQEFIGLSREVAVYGNVRTGAIMKGARKGC